MHHHSLSESFSVYNTGKSHISHPSVPDHTFLSDVCRVLCYLEETKITDGEPESWHGKRGKISKDAVFDYRSFSFDLASISNAKFSDIVQHQRKNVFVS